LKGSIGEDENGWVEREKGATMEKIIDKLNISAVACLWLWLWLTRHLDLTLNLQHVLHNRCDYTTAAYCTGWIAS
jgi:hypothetical protein